MRAAGAQKDASLPVAFIENSSHCATNAAGEKVIGPNKDRRWLPELMAQVLLFKTALLLWSTQHVPHTWLYNTPHMPIMLNKEAQCCLVIESGVCRGKPRA